MPSLGPAEIIVILVVALLVFGPNKMPEIAWQVGRGVREFKRVQQHLTSELRDVVSEFDNSDTASATAPSSDPVPTLPPKVETQPDAPIVPVTHTDGLAAADSTDSTDSTEAPDPISRGQRVWSPPTPPADA